MNPLPVPVWLAVIPQPSTPPVYSVRGENSLALLWRSPLQPSGMPVTTAQSCLLPTSRNQPPLELIDDLLLAWLRLG